MTDTAQRLRDAALKLFTEKGYARTTIADIEKEAGLAPRAGGFYRHFPSKAALVAEIGETSIIETREELGFDLLPLGDTRAELILIAKGYAQASERQAPLAALIAEVRTLPRVQELESRVGAELLDALIRWLSQKPIARGRSRAELVALTVTIFGGWLFYLSKRGQGGGVGEVTDEQMLGEWAGFWAPVLDGGD